MRLTRQASLVIALVAGLMAALGAWIWFAKSTSEPKVEETNTIEIPVPVRAIPAQTELRPGMFHNLAFQKDKLPSDVVTTSQQFQGRVSVIELPAEQPVKVTDIDLKSRMGLAFAVPRGYRAMSVNMDLVATVGDFIKPGNRVDVLVAFEREDQVVVRTIVQDVEVLALDRQTSAPTSTASNGTGANGASNGQSSSNSATAPRAAKTPVTLALTPAQAQVVLASDTAGSLRLSLRSTGEGGVSALPATNSWSLIGAIPKEKTAPAAATPEPAQSQPSVVVNTERGSSWGGPPAQPSAPRRPSVEVIRGGEREVVVP